MAATSAKQVETAKKTAECVWVVEHATRSPSFNAAAASLMSLSAAAPVAC